MSEDNSDFNIWRILTCDYLAIVVLKYMLQYRVQQASGCVLEQEAVLKPVVSYHTRLTPCSTDFYFLCCPLQKLLNAFLAATCCEIIESRGGGGGQRVCFHFFLNDAKVTCVSIVLCLKTRRPTVRRHSRQQPATTSRGQSRRWCTNVTHTKCQLVSWQPAGQFPAFTVNQWLQEWLLTGSYVLRFHFPFWVNFR